MIKQNSKTKEQNQHSLSNISIYKLFLLLKRTFPLVVTLSDYLILMDLLRRTSHRAVALISKYFCESVH